MATKPRRKPKGELVTAIRYHLDGQIEVSRDYGETWHGFKGIIINQAIVEYRAEIEYMKREQEAP